MSFSDILRNNYLDHFDTFGENFDFDTFKNDTFESVCVDRHPLSIEILIANVILHYFNSNWKVEE